MRFGRPFRAVSLCVPLPGPKPWAVLCPPFGRLEQARENVQTPCAGGDARAERARTPVLHYADTDTPTRAPPYLPLRAAPAAAVASQRKTIAQTPRAAAR